MQKLNRIYYVSLFRNKHLNLNDDKARHVIICIYIMFSSKFLDPTLNNSGWLRKQLYQYKTPKTLSFMSTIKTLKRN